MKEYYKDGSLFLINLAIGLGTFIQILDTSIANVAIPYIAGNLSVSPDEGTWVITSFAASNAIVLPLTGWLSNYFGRVRLYIWSVILFSIMSLLCGLATNLTMLVVFRIIQGAVAGSLIPLSQSLIVVNNPPENQGPALGFWAMVVIIAPVLGPVIGGYLTDVYSWPWIFFINVPIGLTSAALVWYFLRDRDSAIIRDPIDWIGLALLSLGVACLQIMLDKGEDLDWFRSNFIIILTIISVISLLYFGIWNYYQKYPIVDFSFFKNRNFVFGTLAITVGYWIYFGSTVTVPLWLQTQQQYTAYWAGVAVAPVGILPFIFSTALGRHMAKFDLRKLAALSFFLFGVSFFYQSTFTTQVDLRTIMFARLMQGTGLMFFFLPLVQLSLGEIPKEKYASASGVFNFIRVLFGSGFGTSLSIALWTRLAIFHHARLSDYIVPAREPIEQFTKNLGDYNPAFNPTIVKYVLEQQAEQQAYMLSTNDILWLSAWLFMAIIPLIFLCKPVRPSGSAPVGAH